MKNLIVFVLSAILLLMDACASPLSTTVPTNGNETPEKTIAALISAVASNQLDAALAVCSPEPLASDFDFAAMYERIKFYNAQAETLTAPSDYAFYLEANKQVLIGETARNILLFSLSFFIQDELDVTIVTGVDAAWTEDFIQKSNPVALKDLKILRIAAPPKSDDPPLIELFKQQAQVYGADERVERVVLLEFRDKKYVCGFSLLRYGSIWYIEKFQSQLAHMSPLSVAYQVPSENLQDDFMKIFE